MKYLYKVGVSFFLCLAVALVSAGSVLASDATIEGNGAKSYNKIFLLDVCDSDVYQKNSTNVSTHLSLYSSTGNNTSSYNTGSGSSIETGSASSSAFVTVLGGGNTAIAPNCCLCDGHADEETIQDNGFKSTNLIKSKDINKSEVTQKSWTSVRTYAKLKSNTGRNRSSGNTGGESSIETDDATTLGDILVESGYNTLLP